MSIEQPDNIKEKKLFWNFSFTNEEFAELKEKGEVMKEVEDKDTLDTKLGEEINAVNEESAKDDKLAVKLISMELTEKNSIICKFKLIEN
ncbi:MAG: hypothetical protein V1825_01735 [Candidatus Falkowbacteria bacterium]|nr:hypothetical protein [Candidatus Parcubacteria bacterium]